MIAANKAPTKIRESSRGNILALIPQSEGQTATVSEPRLAIPTFDSINAISRVLHDPMPEVRTSPSKSHSTTARKPFSRPRDGDFFNSLLARLPKRSLIAVGPARYTSSTSDGGRRELPYRVAKCVAGL